MLVDDSERFLHSLESMLAKDYGLRSARSLDDARKALHPPPDAVVLDLRLDESHPERMDGLDLLKEIVQELPLVPVIIMTAYGDVATAVNCMRLGAADFIQKGGDNREITTRIQKALKGAKLSRRVAELEIDLQLVEPRKLVGDSKRMLEVKRLISGAARDGHVTVLITGETGTGKELVARAIHASGVRAEQPFIPVAASSLPASTLEAELFGYEPGAFTDARKRHTGYFERAHGGILFLDEIGDLDLSLQVKLLRFLEERIITRLGGQEEIQVDVQVITATNADLQTLLKQGKFREDLLYRLRVYEIPVPPLRDRREDIPILAAFFLEKLAREKRGPTDFVADALEALTRHSWPGNIRQLKHAIESAALKAMLSKHARIELSDLSEEVVRSANSPSTVAQGFPPTQLAEQVDLEEELAKTEFRFVRWALEKAGGQKGEAWRVLGLNDRFALRRRVLTLLTRFPQLKNEYPDVADSFVREQKRQSARIRPMRQI